MSSRLPIGVATSTQLPGGKSTAGSCAVSFGGGTPGHGGGRRQPPLEGRGRDAGPHLGDEIGREAERAELPVAQALVDHVVQQAVGLGVGEAQLALVGLVAPEIGAGRLGPHRLGQAQVRRQQADLGLVEVGQRVQAAGVVPVERGVAQQGLGAVARAQDQGAVAGRDVVEHDHAAAGHHVAGADAVAAGVQGAQEGVGHGRDLAQLGGQVQDRGHGLGVALRRG